MSWEEHLEMWGGEAVLAPPHALWGKKFDSALNAGSQHKARSREDIRESQWAAPPASSRPSQYNPQAARDAVTTCSEAAPPGHSTASLPLTVQSRTSLPVASLNFSSHLQPENNT